MFDDDRLVKESHYFTLSLSLSLFFFLSLSLSLYIYIYRKTQLSVIFANFILIFL